MPVYSEGLYSHPCKRTMSTRRPRALHYPLFLALGVCTPLWEGEPFNLLFIISNLCLHVTVRDSSLIPSSFAIKAYSWRSARWAQNVLFFALYTSILITTCLLLHHVSITSIYSNHVYRFDELWTLSIHMCFSINVILSIFVHIWTNKNTYLYVFLFQVCSAIDILH